jgi:hypothetical protein
LGPQIDAPQPQALLAATQSGAVGLPFRQAGPTPTGGPVPHRQSPPVTMLQFSSGSHVVPTSPQRQPLTIGKHSGLAAAGPVSGQACTPAPPAMSVPHRQTPPPPEQVSRAPQAATPPLPSQSQTPAMQAAMPPPHAAPTGLVISVEPAPQVQPPAVQVSPGPHAAPAAAQ